ncbi:hypothetical protein QTP81_13625 [Alteromonas sp. ASW11-36]|uniref:Uncharacterized protein n=1 Tax=Alteromonas arenosi TaxID=3055817 RepID=A0ABT7SZM5_9ALTE|nr:hypothetical protein [Alteromonas sp. ASW11-36]MDM7861635.1 hypothetical protein [Alteromonas sp. ASW11-36]
MSENRITLGFPEVDYKNFKYDRESLSFTAVELVDIQHRLKYEVVEVRISGIQAISIELRPFQKGEYGPSSNPVSIGKTMGKSDYFEGITRENIFSSLEAEYFWISAELNANSVELVRTGTYEYKDRPKGS